MENEIMAVSAVAEAAEPVEITFAMDTKTAEDGLEEILKSMEALRLLAGQIGAAIGRAFSNMGKQLGPLEAGIKSLTTALGTAADQMGMLMQEMMQGQAEDRLWSIAEIITSLFNTIVTGWPVLQAAKDGILAFIGTIMPMISGLLKGIGAVSGAIMTWITGTVVPAISGVLTTIGGAVSALAAGLGISVGWLVAIIAAVAAAIAAVIIYWDEIVFFFTDTFPKALQQCGEWIMEAFQAVGDFIGTLWSGAVEGWQEIQNIFSGIAKWIHETVILPVISIFAGLWNAVLKGASGAWTGICNAFSNAWGWFRDKLLLPLESGFKNTVNGVIGFINGLISGFISGINTIVRALNRIHFDIPSWVPGIGGESIGFQLQTIKAPQIPYLAKGAVLPANRPFLAMVGDQRHGTNVEAPLSTIQEAVAAVMQEQITAMMAGFQALLEEQRATRETIAGIEVGDTVIGEAALRYNQNRAIITGLW